jgi:ABC-2 type transport system ATP-binding protein
MDDMTVQVTALSHRFDKETVLRDVDMEIPSGLIVGLLGPSGSGKTTLIRCMIGLLKPTAGTVQIGGRLVPDRSLPPDLGYMAQSDALYEDLSGLENLRFFGSLYGLRGRAAREGIDRVLALTLLAGHERKRVRHYSGGMRKRLSLAIALLHEPRLLVLDEPTIGIDPVLRAQFWGEFQRLKAAGRTLVLTTHVMDEAARCDRLGMIFEGRLLAYGTPREIMERTGAGSVEEAFLALRRASNGDAAKGAA